MQLRKIRREPTELLLVQKKDIKDLSTYAAISPSRRTNTKGLDWGPVLLNLHIGLCGILAKTGRIEEPSEWGRNSG